MLKRVFSGTAWCTSRSSGRIQNLISISFVLNRKEESFLQESIQVMLVALGAVSFGVLFDNIGSGSIFFSTVGMIFIMGAFLIGISGFVIFMRDWILKYSD